MSLRPLIFFICYILMLSCNRDQTIYMLDNEANGVEVGTEIVVKGIKVGKVNYLTVTPEGEVLMTGKIDPEFKIPKDSRFRNIEGEPTGETQISVDLGESTELLTDKDTVDLRSTLNKLLNFGKEEVLDKLIDRAEEKLRENEEFDTIVKTIEDILK